jgi:hypothetical protein
VKEEPEEEIDMAELAKEVEEEDGPDAGGPNLLDAKTILWVEGERMIVGEGSNFGRSSSAT